MSVFYIILAILLFGLMVGIHEGGHFAAAKACGVKVEEFSLGMGPAIWKKRKGETLYALRCIPFGGYCMMTGEDEAVDDPRAFTSQPAWKRIIILFAGAFMNFVLGFVIVLILYSSSAYAYRGTQIVSFQDGCPYQGEAGLQVGDRFLKIDGQRIYLQSDITDFLQQGDGVYDIVVRRDGRRVTLKDFPMTRIEYPGQSRKLYGFNLGYEEATPLTTLRYSWNTTMEFGRWVWMGLRELVHGGVSVEDMSGPVGIVDYMAETGEQAESLSDGLYNVFYFTAFITVNLAIMNLLPIPALDGGRIFLLLVSWIVESLTHKKLDPKYEGYIHAAGMVLLLGLMAFVMFHDIWRIFTK